MPEQQALRFSRFSFWQVPSLKGARALAFPFG
jgi:hypothetical protein